MSRAIAECDSPGSGGEHSQRRGALALIEGHGVVLEAGHLPEPTLPCTQQHSQHPKEAPEGPQKPFPRSTLGPSLVFLRASGGV